ncbi:MAG: DUF4097 domain-containing protein [Bauldia sp.]
MPTFPTPRPILVAIDMAIADVTLVATERAETTVDIRPSRAAKLGDVRAADQTAVDFVNDRLTIRGPKPRLLGIGIGRREAVDVTIAVPSGSQLDVDIWAGSLRAEGRLGKCRVKLGDGNIVLGDVAALIAETGRGDVDAGEISDRSDINTGMGAIRIRAVRRAAAIKNSFGAIEIGGVEGEVRISAASGNITLGETRGNVVVKTAYGDVRVADVVGGQIQLDTAYGQAEIGIHDGTAAWLDAHTSYGRVLNMLGPHDGSPSGETAEIRARTAYGDIAIRRAVTTHTNGRRVA